MKLKTVDERDVLWAVDDPVFRVHRWSLTRSDGGVESSAPLYAVDVLEITDADVGEVLRWVDENPTTTGCDVVYVMVRDRAEGLGAYRIAGRPPEGHW